VVKLAQHDKDTETAIPNLDLCILSAL